MKRIWDQGDFQEAYKKYSSFYKWMKEEVGGNPTLSEMLSRYAPQAEDRRMELRVMYEVTKIARKNGLRISTIRFVTLNSDGGVDVDVAQ